MTPAARHKPHSNSRLLRHLLGFILLVVLLYILWLDTLTWSQASDRVWAQRIMIALLILHARGVINPSGLRARSVSFFLSILLMGILAFLELVNFIRHINLSWQN